jgi:transcriptional regulator with XRE-family HTH domain
MPDECSQRNGQHLRNSAELGQEQRRQPSDRGAGNSVDSAEGVASSSVASASGESRPRASAEARSGSDAPSANPTIRQRELGIRLRELRNALGLTVEEVAEQLLVSATKISRLETGGRRANLRDVRDLCRIYGVIDPGEIEDLMDLARQSREPGWWTRYEDLNMSPYLGLEQEATAITSFSMYYVPPLMQTGEYARSMITGIARRMHPKVLDERIEARMRRQTLLDQSSSPRYRAIIDEAVLHRKVGGPEVMRAQLERMLVDISGDKSTVQVLPFDVGAYGAVDSNFDLLDFAVGSRQNSVVFVEGLYSNLYLERPDQVGRYREALEYLRDAALSPRDSIALIRKAQTDYAGLSKPDLR